MKRKRKNNIVYLKPAVPIEEAYPRVNKVPKVPGSSGNYNRIAILIIFIIVLYYAYLNIGVFVTAEITKIHTESISSNNRYQIFGNQILRYGKDGMGIMDKKGSEIWNAPYQISNPIVEITGDSIIIADRNGNKIMVMDQNSVKGEIETALPIEKVSVSSQGIVAALLKDTKGSKIVCYDAVGNILAELVAPVSSIGYPIDLAISYDGTKVIATYLQYNEGTVNSTYRCYSLETAEATSAEKIILEEMVSGTVIPTTFFINQTTAAIVLDNGIHIYNLSSEELEKVEIIIEKEIGQVFYNESYMGVQLKQTAADTGNELRIYNTKGKQVSSIEYQGEYSNIKIVEDQVFLYDGTRCIIYRTSGKEVFQGVLDLEIAAILPRFGINKYLVVGKESIVDIRLKR